MIVNSTSPSTLTSSHLAVKVTSAVTALLKSYKVSLTYQPLNTNPSFTGSAGFVAFSPSSTFCEATPSLNVTVYSFTSTLTSSHLAYKVIVPSPANVENGFVNSASKYQPLNT